MLVKHYLKNQNITTFNIQKTKIYVIILKKINIIIKEYVTEFYKYKNFFFLAIKLIKIIKNNFYKLSNQLIKNTHNFITLISYILTIHFYNSNIFINITDIKGKKNLYVLSSGILNIKSSKKNKNLVLKNIVKKVIFKLKYLNITFIALHIKSSKKNRKYFIKELKKYFFLNYIKFYNLTPHNGCRPKKKVRKK